MKQAAFTTSRICALFAALALTATANAAYNVPTTISNGPVRDYLLLPNGNTVYTGYTEPTSTERNVYIYDHIAKTSQAIAATALDEFVDSLAGANARNDFLYISWPDLYMHDGISNANVLVNTAPIQGAYPLLSANGGVIWMQADPGSTTSSDIWYKSSSTSSPINISNSPYDDYGMSFYSDGVNSYILYFRTVGGTFNVMRYNIATQVTTNMTTSYGVADNYWSNNKGDIVWASGGYPVTSLSIYTAATGSVATIPATGAEDFFSPRINSFGDVIWTKNGALYRMASGGVPTLIVGWTGGQVNGTYGGYDFLPNGDVLYNGPGAAGGGSDIFVYSRTAGTSVNITNQPLNSGIPWSWVNANGDVTWETSLDGNFVDEIFVYTKATGAVDRLTNDSISDYYPRINNDGQVVWFGLLNPDTQPTFALYSATPALPDLTVGSGTATSTVATGGAVSGNYSLSNIGTGAAAASTMGLVLSANTTVGDADDTLMTSVAIAQLAAGTSQVGSYSFAMNKPAGTYYLYAVADYSKVLAESNESNNNLLLATITVTNPTGSDLVVTAVSHATTSVSRGKSFSISSTVKNQGTSKTKTTSQIDAGVYLSTDAVCATSDYRIGSWKVRSAGATLAAGASVSKNGASYTVPASGVPAGTYYVCAFADYKLKEAESNETNNGRVSSYNSGKIVVK